MPECPYFGEWFRSNIGLNRHIAKTHEFKFLGGKILDFSTVDQLGAVNDFEIYDLKIEDAKAFVGYTEAHIR
ncbi:MAG: hypothetical protein QFX36_00920 [Archaeoglobales archaeon]|nr:hypothetical protein [Archaeoglobales archaeon]